MVSKMLLGQHPKSSAVKRGTLLPTAFSIPSLVLIALGTCYLQFLQDAILHPAGCLCIGSILSRMCTKVSPSTSLSSYTSWSPTNWISDHVSHYQDRIISLKLSHVLTELESFLSLPIHFSMEKNY